MVLEVVGIVVVAVCVEFSPAYYGTAGGLGSCYSARTCGRVGRCGKVFSLEKREGRDPRFGVCLLSRGTGKKRKNGTDRFLRRSHLNEGGILFEDVMREAVGVFGKLLGRFHGF